MSIDEDWERSGLVGKLVAGKYLIASTLAQTPRSEVHEAEVVEKGTRVALKILKAHPAAATIQKHAREKTPLPRFEHAAIVDVLEVGTDGADTFVLSELVRGESLSSLLAKGPLAAPRALGIARQVLGALEAAHAKNVVHRDLSSEHVLLVPGEGGAETVRVLGFPLAKLNTAAADTFADPKYIAPEQVLKTPAGKPADLYSVGALLFEMLTGHALFHAESARELMRLHAYGPAQTLKQRAPEREFTEATESLVERALVKLPHKRFKSAAEMIAAVDSAIASVDEVEAKAAAAAASEADESATPEPPVDDSLLRLGRELMAAPGEAPPPPVIPLNVERTVQALPWTMRAEKWVRQRSKRQLAIAGAAGLLLIVVMIVTCSGGEEASVRPAVTRDVLIARRDAVVPKATALLAAKQPQQAVELLAKEIESGTPASEELRAVLRQVIAVGSPAAGVVALDVAGRLSPVPAAMVSEQAAAGTTREIRHRAIAIAQTHGFEARIDRIASWSRDLEQSKSCDEQRAIVATLIGTGDQRALAPLRAARSNKCVAKDVAAGIAKLEAAH